MRLLAGVEAPLPGSASRRGTTCMLAYFAQDQAKALDRQLTVLEQITRAAPFDMVPQLRDILGAFLFSGDDVHKKVAVLSGGERNRLALAILLLRPANLLLLDEPTNHLDLQSKEVLLDALQKLRAGRWCSSPTTATSSMPWRPGWSRSAAARPPPISATTRISCAPRGGRGISLAPCGSRVKGGSARRLPATGTRTDRRPRHARAQGRPSAREQKRLKELVEVRERRSKRRKAELAALEQEHGRSRTLSRCCPLARGLGAPCRAAGRIALLMAAGKRCRRRSEGRGRPAVRRHGRQRKGRGGEDHHRHQPRRLPQGAARGSAGDHRLLRQPFQRRQHVRHRRAPRARRWPNSSPGSPARELVALGQYGVQYIASARACTARRRAAIAARPARALRPRAGS